MDCLDDANQVQTDLALANSIGGGQAITGTPAVAWRLNGGEVRLDIISRRPNNDELASLVAFAESLQQP